MSHQYVASVLNPQTNYTARVPTAFPISTTTHHIHVSSSLVSNGDGNSFGVLGSGGCNGSLRTQNVFTGWNVAADYTSFLNNTLLFAGGTPYSQMSRPFAALEPFINEYRLVSMSWVITYTGNLLTASGTCASAWFDTKLTSNTTVYRADVESSPNIVVRDAKSGLRYIWTPRNVEQTNLFPVNDSCGQSYGIVYWNGLPPNIVFGRIDVYMNIEARPTPLYAPIANTDRSGADTQTIADTAAMVLSSPSLKTLQLPVATMIGQGIDAQPSVVGHLMSSHRDYAAPGTAAWLNSTLTALGRSSMDRFLSFAVL